MDKGVTKQVSAQPPSCSSPGEIQAHVRTKKWLNMGLSDQISHQSSTLGDSFSHQYIHFWILITYTSVVQHILVNLGTLCLGVMVGVLVGFCCSWGVFLCFVFFLAWFFVCFWWVLLLLLLVFFNNCSLLTCGFYWLLVVTNLSNNCSLFGKLFSPYAQQSTLWNLAQIPQNLPVFLLGVIISLLQHEWK